MKKILSNLKPYWIFILASLIFIFCQAMSQLILPSMLADIVNTGIVNGDTGYILSVGGKMLLVALGAVCAAVAASYCSSRAAMGFGKSLRESIFEKVESFSLNEFNKIGTASLITRTTNDVTQLQMVAMIFFRMVVMSPIMAIGAIIMAVSTAPSLSFVFWIVVPIIAGGIIVLSKFSLPLFRAMQAKIDTVNRVMRENLTGVRVIRAFNRVEHEKKRFNAANIDLTNVAIKVNRLMAIMMPFIMLIFNVTTVAIVWYASLKINAAMMEVGDLLAFIQYAMEIMFSTMMLSMMFIMIPRAAASVERIKEVLNMEPEIVDSENPAIPKEIKGILEFDNVTFKYPDAEEPALSNISFKTLPGHTTAIIGATGSGKSTISNLIMRFYDVTSGKITIDGIDIRAIPQKVLRSWIGYVPQKSVLFTGTIAENIRYGKKDATDEEVRHAAEIAQASEFINEMKDGFNTILAEGGLNVSGGQKQRICIARAIVKKPKIYLFDDSFSALDFKTDAKLRMALSKETKNSTMIIVAQRVATVMNADQIIVLDEGKIAGIGKHKELYENCETYRNIVLSQLSEEEIA